MKEQIKDVFRSLLRTEDLPQELLDEYEDWLRLSYPINPQHRPMLPFDFIAIAKSALDINVAEDGGVTSKPLREPAPDAVTAPGSDAKLDAKPEPESDTELLNGADISAEQWQMVTKGADVMWTRGGQTKPGTFVELADRGRKVINVNPTGVPKHVQFTKSELQLVVPKGTKVPEPQPKTE